MSGKRLLIVAHTPSSNTARLLDAVLSGAHNPNISGVETVAKSPFDTKAKDVMEAHGIILGTTENLGYMSGALKDFFDRIYYESITTGLRWKAVQEPLILRGDLQEAFVAPCKELGMAMAAGLEAGII